MNSTVTAVVLAGGEGKRFAPFTTNKTLFPFLGKPLIQHTLEMLAKGGITEALVITSEHSDESVRGLSIPNLNIKTHKQKEPKGMADALLSAKAILHSTPILIVNSVDIVEPVLIDDMLRKAPSCYALVAGIVREKYFPGGYLDVQNNRVIGVVEKPGAGREPSKYVNLVFHYFKEPAFFISLLEEVAGAADDHYEQALSRLMKEKEVGFVPYRGYWSALKYAHFTLDVMDMFLANYVKPYAAQSAFISEHAIIQGDVYIDEGAKIYENAIVKGPAYIGRNVVVGNGALVRQSLIEEGAVVGFGSEVARSYIGPQCMLHHNFIGDSVLEGYVNPSYGTTTANWRIDGKEVDVHYEKGKVSSGRTKFGVLIGTGVFLGVNCSLMPGTVVGSGAKIYPVSVVHGNIKANSTLKPHLTT